MGDHIVFIIGCGPRIGANTALAFRSQGYRVAVASRSVEPGMTAGGDLAIRLDAADVASMFTAFRTIKDTFGSPPCVVVYNAYSRAVLPDQDPLGALDAVSIATDFAVNAAGAIVAAKCAVQGFTELPAELLKTFIYTGNKLNVMTMPSVLTFGMAKAGVAWAVPSLIQAYGSRGFRFYYTDERQPDGNPAAGMVDGPARGTEYLSLAKSEDQGPWHYTFVKGRGYRDFSATDGTTVSIPRGSVP